MLFVVFELPSTSYIYIEGTGGSHAEGVENVLLE